jgi:hypothetical protein
MLSFLGGTTGGVAEEIAKDPEVGKISDVGLGDVIRH